MTITFLALICFSSSTYGLDKEFLTRFGNSRESFCKVKDWESGINTKKEVGVELYKKLKIAKPIEGRIALKKIKKDGWIIVDARDKEARRATGKITGTILLTSDYNKDAENEFSKEKILKKLANKKNKKILTRNEIKNVKKLSDLKNINYILFCNGYKCHRSTWGACQLREYGVPYENIHIVLGGFSQLKDHGAKIK